MDSTVKQDEFALKTAFLYFIANGISSAMSTTLSPISSSLKTYYSVSESTIFYLNSTYMIYFIIVNFFANYVIDKYGVKNSVNLCLLLTLIGAWLRISIHKKLIIMLIGQTIMAIAFPFITNCLSKISNIWFTPQNRVKMTSLMSSSYMFGLGFGFLLTSLFWDKHNTEETVSSNLHYLMYISAVVCSFACVPVFLYFREEPDIPPSFSAEAQREDFLSSIFIIIKNKDFVLLFIFFSLSLGNFITLCLMIHHVIAPYGYSEYEISNIGLIINVFSGISKLVIAYIAGYWITIRKSIIYILVLLSFSVILFMYALTTKSIWFVYFSSAIIGFFCQMYWGPALEFSCEIAYPVSESHANGYLLLGGNIVGLIINYFVSYFYENISDPQDFFLYLIASYIFCTVCVYFIKDEDKRDIYEHYALENIDKLRKNENFIKDLKF